MFSDITAELLDLLDALRDKEPGRRGAAPPVRSRAAAPTAAAGEATVDAALDVDAPTDEAAPRKRRRRRRRPGGGSDAGDGSDERGPAASPTSE